MFIPLGTDRPLRRTPAVTCALIFLNIAAFAVLMISAARGPDAALAGGRIAPDAALLQRFELVRGWAEPWRYVTYAFLHAGWMHLLGNTLFLWVFGPNVEDRLGRFGFIALYLAGAAATGLAHTGVDRLLHPDFPTPIVGASGAISTITGAYLILFPLTHIRTFVFFIYVGVYAIPAVWFLGAALLRDFLMLGANDNVSRVAHLAGYTLGGLVSFALLGTRVLDREMYDAFSLAHQAKRRRDIREASRAIARRPGPANPEVAGRIGRSFAPERAPEAPYTEEAATLRADIASRLSRGDAPGAAPVYKMLASQFPDHPKALTLSRHNQVAVANQLFQSGDHALAARAYAMYLDAYPTDGQAPHVRLMLGLLCARYLAQPDRARAEITAALPRLADADDAALARQLLGELAAPAGGRHDKSVQA